MDQPCFTSITITAGAPRGHDIDGSFECVIDLGREMDAIVAKTEDPHHGGIVDGRG